MTQIQQINKTSNVWKIKKKIRRGEIETSKRWRGKIYKTSKHECFYKEFLLLQMDFSKRRQFRRQYYNTITMETKKKKYYVSPSTYNTVNANKRIIIRLGSSAANIYFHLGEQILQKGEKIKSDTRCLLFSCVLKINSISRYQNECSEGTVIRKYRYDTYVTYPGRSTIIYVDCRAGQETG